jgi:sulfur carrier protein
MTEVSTNSIEVTVNGGQRSIEPRTTVLDLVRELGLEGKRIAVERNGMIVARSRHADTVLAAGDKVEIVGAVGGG